MPGMETMNRRMFIGSASAAALMSRFGWAAGEHRIAKVGVQLYTVRDAMQKDFEGTLARVAKIGYKEVEFAGYLADVGKLNPPPKRVREMLDADGLSAPSTHVPYASLAVGNWPRVIEAAEILGHKYIVNPSIDRQLAKTADGWKKAAETFNRAGTESLRSGIQLAYHNHVEEFKPVEGKLPYDILLTECDPKLVQMEIDIFWMIKGKHDPLRYFAQYPDRFPMVHAKDMTKNGDMVDVGRGMIDFGAIFRHSDDAGLKHIFVEHDEPTAPMDDARMSYEYLRRLEY